MKVISGSVIDSFRGQTRWLSNFGEVHRLWAFGVRVPTVEHGYQAAKCEDPSDRQPILDADTPRKARELGQLVVMREDWEDVKDHVMYTLLRRKFSNSNTRLRDLLLITDTAVLIEGNTWGDRYWGCTKPKPHQGHSEWCTSEKCWVGKNRLGELLMQVRAELRLLRGL